MMSNKIYSKQIIKFPLTSNKVVEVTISKKRMKNMRLSINKSGKINISIPYSASYNYAYDFLLRKRDWLIEQLNKIAVQSKDVCQFCDNGNVFLLGNSYPLKLTLSKSNKVQFNGNIFLINSKNLDQDYVKQVFIKWCKTYFKQFFIKRLNLIYPQIFKDNNLPEIKIKCMKSMWGNCNFVRRVVTLNLYLCKAKIECVDYVITHELCHLIHHNHSTDFHAIMTKLLPDWKRRKKLLNTYSLKF